MTKMVVVDALIEKDGKILLVKRGRNVEIGKLAFPGGRADNYERVEKAVVREVKEETNLDINPITILGVYSGDRDPRGDSITTAFICEIIGGELNAGDDAQDVSWYDIDKVDPKELAFDHAKILEDYKKWKTQKGTYWSTK